MIQLDLKELCAQPRFRRFLLHITKLSGIFTPTAGAIETLQFREGQRSLGLDILREASRGLPRGTSIEQMIALVLSEPTQKETQDEPDATSDIDRD